MKEKPNYYAIIPAMVRYDKDLIPNAKLLYGEITALSNTNGYAYASNEYFAKLYNVSKTSISLWIKDLEEKGYIETVLIYKENTKQILQRNIYIVDDPTQENLKTLFKKSYIPSLRKLKDPIKENLKDNNTSNNTTSNNNIYTHFELFWKEYPKKISKQQAFKSFNKIDPDEELLEIMLNKIRLFKQTSDWLKDNGQFIPYPATWLNQVRWEDEIKEEDVPGWFDEEQELEAISKEEEKELKELLKNF